MTTSRASTAFATWCAHANDRADLQVDTVAFSVNGGVVTRELIIKTLLGGKASDSRLLLTQSGVNRSIDKR